MKTYNKPEVQIAQTENLYLLQSVSPNTDKYVTFQPSLHTGDQW